MRRRHRQKHFMNQGESCARHNNHGDPFYFLILAGQPVRFHAKPPPPPNITVRASGSGPHRCNTIGKTGGGGGGGRRRRSMLILGGCI